MSSDRQVTPKMILQAIADLQRRGTRRVMEDLETFEPDLTEYLLESLSTIHHELFRDASSRHNAMRLYRKIQSLTLVMSLATRSGQEALWRDLLEDHPPSKPVNPPAGSEEGKPKPPMNDSGDDSI